MTLLHFLRRAICYGRKNPSTNFLFGVIRSVSKSISERQTSLQKCGQPFPRGSNPAGLLRFHKIHNLMGFEPYQKLIICIFRQNPVLVGLWTDRLCMQKSIRAKLACSQSFFMLVEAFQSHKHPMKNVET